VGGLGRRQEQSGEPAAALLRPDLRPHPARRHRPARDPPGQPARNIALVSQEITLFNDSVAANIAYGRQDSVSHDAIERAADAANALEFHPRDCPKASIL
jgi:hypothetical protein